MVSSTCFEHPSVHFEEDLYMQFYGTSMHPYKQSGRLDAWKKYRKTACKILPEDKNLDVRNMSKPL